MFKEKKQKLKEYQENYREAKKFQFSAQSNRFLVI